MGEVTVRLLGESDWQQYREFRLAALRDAPEAFVASLETEEGYDEQLWRDRMNRSSRFLAEDAGTPVGIASVRGGVEDFEDAGELFGLWVRPERRGTGAAAALVLAASTHMSTQGMRQLVYWVGSDNARAVAFASSYGFRPTEYRRPMSEPKKAESEDGDEELAMVLALPD